MPSILLFNALLAYYFENFLLLFAEDLILLQDKHFLKQVSLLVYVEHDLLFDLKAINDLLLFPCQLFLSPHLLKDLLILHHIICSVGIILKLKVAFILLRIIWVLAWDVIVRVRKEDDVTLKLFFLGILLLVVLAQVGQWTFHLRLPCLLLLLIFFNAILTIFYLRLKHFDLFRILLFENFRRGATWKHTIIAELMNSF